MRKIKYSCKNCGWETSIREEWGDLRPKRCMNKKCNTSFQARPEMLIIERPKSHPKQDKKVDIPSIEVSKEEASKEDSQKEEDKKPLERRHGRKKR